MTQLTSRELFKSIATSLSLPSSDPRYGKPFDVNQPYKNWCDETLLSNPGYIGKKTITSPQGVSVIVTYSKNFVEYQFGLQYVDGQPIVDRLIISREDALLFNVFRGDEKGSQVTDITSYTDFPMDRGLVEGEYIGRPTPFAPYQIMSKSDVPESQEIVLARIESKIDLLIAKLVK